MGISYCNNIEYPKFWGFKREPARPQKLRIDYCNGMKFDSNFDWNNIWYDAVKINSNMVILIGPPLYNAKEWMHKNISFDNQHNNDLKFKFVELDRVCYTIIQSNNLIDTLYLHTRIQDNEFQILLNYSENIFNNKSVMVTLQKNNPINWIVEWIQYHNKVLGVEGFLIYDNDSTLYDLIKLEYELKKATNATVQVVGWPYPYGPQGSDNAPWDSDYGQYVMLEHAKIRFLGNAKLVINSDIDELVVLDNVTLDDIANYLKNNTVNCLKFKGTWIQPINYETKIEAKDIELSKRTFKDYYCIDSNYKTGIGYKWMLVPTDNMLNTQWLVHSINGQMLESNQIEYRHYLSQNTNWSWVRDKFTGNIDDLIIDQLLLNNLNKF